MSDTPKTPEGQAPSKMIGRVARALAGVPMRGDYDEVPVDEVFSRPRYSHLAHQYRREAWAAIEAYEAALAEAGLVIVPREPTEEMVNAGKHVVVSVLAQTIKPEQIQTLVYTGVQEYRAMIGVALGRKP